MHEKKVRMTDFTRKYLPSQDVLKLRVFTHGQILIQLIINYHFKISKINHVQLRKGSSHLLN